MKESTILVIDNDYKSNPFKSLELALKVEFQCIVITDFDKVKLCKDITPDNLLFVNKEEIEPISELSLNGWSANWEIRDEGEFSKYKFRLDWKYYSPSGECRNRDISRYTGMTNIIEAIKEIKLLSSYPDWKSLDLFEENQNLKKMVEKQQSLIVELESKLNSIKNLL